MDADVLNLPGAGLAAVDIALTPTLLLVRIASTAAGASCPRCRCVSDRVHSRYTRTVADLPAHDRPVALRPVVRRFRCTTPGCPRAIFCQRLPGLASPHARTTDRLAGTHRPVGLAPGGEPRPRLADHLDIPTSPDTLLRRVKRSDGEPAPPPRFIGIDDWAWRKGRRHGTIVVDLERVRVVDLLPDRDAETVRAWPSAHPGVELISRDRWSEYAQAAAEGAPAARQVVDRWHLLKNLREAVERLFERQAGPITQALKSPRRSSPRRPRCPLSRSDRRSSRRTCRRAIRPGDRPGNRPSRRSGSGAPIASRASTRCTGEVDRSEVSPRSWASLATPCVVISGARPARTGDPVSPDSRSRMPPEGGSIGASERGVRMPPKFIGSWPLRGVRPRTTRSGGT